MVRVRQEQPLHFDGSIDLENWLCQLNERVPQLNLSRVRNACDLSQQAEEKAIATNSIWRVGQSSFKIGLDMADILTELHVDEDGIVAAIIYRAVRENQITLNHVRNNFGVEVADLVEGVLRMAAISDIQFNKTKILGKQSDQLEQAKRMLVALVDDVRVALLKLAERTCAIRNIAKTDHDRQVKLAREVFDIYAPLAHRLGIGHLKWELEDIAFRYLEPEAYMRIAGLLDEKRTARQEYISKVKETLTQKLKIINIEADLEGRAKHIYSIWRKMRSKEISFSEVYDVRAVRILVADESDCYRVLGVVHNLWRNIPHEFDDYIAVPKENGYRSLHTAVFGPEGKVLEIQIRTREMHEEAEFGVCSHWQYKTYDGSEPEEEEPKAYQDRISWLRQILDWQEELGDVSEIAKAVLDEASLDRIYVYTPEGHVIDMMPGATPVDFAYRVHTEVGHRCRGARVNNRVVSLNTKLRSGDQIEIITADEAEPRREWLHDHLGYVTTSRARAKIQSWFGNRTKRKNTLEGEKLLAAELRYLGLDHIDPAALLPVLRFKSLSSLYAAIGAGDINAFDVIDAAATELEAFGSDNQLDFPFRDEKEASSTAVLVGVGDLPFVIEECCKPLPGDAIVGLIDDDSLIHVHSQGCIQALQGDSYGRLMRLDWNMTMKRVFPVQVNVEAYDRFGLLHEITGVFVDQQSNVTAMNSITDKQNNRVALTMTMEVTSLNELVRTLEKIEQLANVISARRAPISN
jgi:GTP pyrophosphokinase